MKDITSVKHRERTSFSEPSLTRTILPLQGNIASLIFKFWVCTFTKRNKVALVLLHRMQKLAKELGVVIPVSFFEEANNAHYNSIAIIDADGTDLGIYRKSHIPDGPGESSLDFGVGNNSSLFYFFTDIFS